jgi:7 transmembrane receptor (rhodopsin family).
MSQNDINNLPFFCCIQDSLLNIEFRDFEHIHNLTHDCRVHTNYDSADAFTKKVIKMLIVNHENKTEETRIKCASLATQFLIDNNNCNEKTQGVFNFYVLVWLLMLILGSVGNALVLIAFWKSKKLRKNVENFFLASLATSDLMLLVFIVPMKMEYALNNFNFCASLAMCRLFITTDHLFFIASILSIFSLTFSRYITIIKPYDFRKIITPVRVKLAIVFLWMVAIIFAINSNIDAEHLDLRGVELSANKCVLKHLAHVTTYILYIVIFFLPCSIMLGMYIHINYISRLHTKTIRYDSRRVCPPSNNNNNNQNKDRRNSSSKISLIIQQSASFINKKLDTRATRVLVLLFGSFVACWLPTIVVIYLQVFGVVKSLPDGVYALLQFLPVLHSTMDPFIYGVFHKEFRSTLKRMLGISYLVYQRRGSGSRIRNLSTNRSNLEVPSNLGTHRNSSGSFQLTTPRTPEKTEDGYPIYKIRFVDDDGISPPMIKIDVCDDESGGSSSPEDKSFEQSSEGADSINNHSDNNLCVLTEKTKMLREQ